VICQSVFKKDKVSGFPEAGTGTSLKEKAFDDFNVRRLFERNIFFPKLEVFKRLVVKEGNTKGRILNLHRK